MDVIPAIDLLDGKAVRLREGRFDAVTVYDDDPAATAAAWASTVPRLHIVDLEGAKQGAPVQRDLVRRIAEAFGPGVQVGGGIRSTETAEAYFELGVERVVLGTAAIRDPELVARIAARYPGRVVVAVDAKGGKVATDGWLDVSELTAVDVSARFADAPIAALLYTDIARDGTERGPNVAATAQLARDGAFPVIASGGVGTLEHLETLAEVARELPDGRLAGAIVGRALHERRFTLERAVRAAAG